MMPMRAASGVTPLVSWWRGGWANRPVAWL